MAAPRAAPRLVLVLLVTNFMILAESACDFELQPGAEAPFLRPVACPPGQVQKAGAIGCESASWTACIQHLHVKGASGQLDANVVNVAVVPNGTKDFFVSIFSSASDIDISMWDRTHHRWVVHSNHGVVHGPKLGSQSGQQALRLEGPLLEIDYEGMAIQYSGDKRNSPMTESIFIEGTTPSEFEIKVNNHENMATQLKYTFHHHGMEACISPPASKVCEEPPVMTTRRPRISTEATSGQPQGRKRIALIAAVLSGLCLLLVCFIIVRKTGRRKQLSRVDEPEDQPLVFDDHKHLRDKINRILERAVEFKHQEHKMKEKGIAVISDLAQELKDHPEVPIVIYGYTAKPPLGQYRSYEDVKLLSYLRAEQIKIQLCQEGATNQIVCRGFGAFPGKGARCEILPVSKQEALKVEREAQADGQQEGMSPLTPVP